MMERQYRVDLALFDPEVAADPETGSGVVCEMTSHGETLEGAIASAIVTMAPHVVHMNYEFAVLGVGVWCETHACYHNVSEEIEGTGHIPKVVLAPEGKAAN